MFLNLWNTNAFISFKVHFFSLELSIIYDTQGPCKRGFKVLFTLQSYTIFNLITNMKNFANISYFAHVIVICGDLGQSGTALSQSLVMVNHPLDIRVNVVSLPRFMSSKTLLSSTDLKSVPNSTVLNSSHLNSVLTYSATALIPSWVNCK